MVQLEDPAGDVVEEVPVVGDGHDRARVLLQRALEPGHRLGVEVVGGLVQQEQVGLREQEAAEGDTATLTAGERGDVGVGWREPQGVHGHLDGALEVPGAGGLDLGLELGLLGTQLLVVGIGVGPLGEHGVVASQQVCRGTDAVHDVAVHVLVVVQLRLLLQQAHGEALGQAGLAGEAVVEAGHDAQQRGLAGAVATQHADLRAGVEGEGDVLQDLAVGRVEPRDLRHREDVLGVRRRHEGRTYRCREEPPNGCSLKAPSGCPAAAGATSGP